MTEAVKEWGWEVVEDRVENYMNELAIPDLGIPKTSKKEDVLPLDMANVSGRELSERLAEYSGYVSYLDVELGRIDSQLFAIKADLSRLINEETVSGKTTKAKATVQVLNLPANVSLRRGYKRSIELEALYKRIAGLREGYAVRMQAISREITRRGSEA